MNHSNMLAPQELAQFICAQRWFGGKSKKIVNFEMIASLPLVENCDWQIVAVEYDDQSRELYQIPLIRGDDALNDADFRGQLLQLLGQSDVRKGRSVDIVIESFSPPEPDGDSRFLAIEQSNSSVVYGNTSFLKFFRKLEGGVNPEMEILKHLTGFGGNVRAPRVFATLQINYRNETYALAVLLEMVANQGNAWELALERAGKGKDFLESAKLLGTRTAEMHLALAASTSDGDFGIVQATADDWKQRLAKVSQDTNEMFSLLAAKVPALNGPSAELARDFLGRKEEHVSKVLDLNELISYPTIRVHGDYHLGQVLVTDSDFMIIDFDGEPARSLRERRSRQSPLVDVAGMLRSFHYAGCVSGNFAWQKPAAAAFLDSYLTLTRGTEILPDEVTVRTLLEVFQWQKKLYEIRYELNNRPDWLWIPLK